MAILARPGRSPLAWVLLPLLLLAPPTRGGADELLDGPGLRAHMEGLATLLTQREGAALPELTDADYARLAAGKSVIKQQTLEGTAMLGATVFQVTDVAAWRIWLAICDRDHHEEFMPHIKEGVCLQDHGHFRLVYQYLALPGIKDRHWIIRTRTNGALWLSSGRSIWESSWVLDPAADELIGSFLEAGSIENVTPEQVEAAIVTPRNDGCWLLVDLPDGRTYIAYQDLSDIGGNVPAWLVNELGPSGLESLVDKVAQRGREIEQHFSDSRPPPRAPDGTEVEQLDAD